MPRFIVITGLPASGKSTVGAAVASALALPLLDKDEILEALFDSLGVGDDEWRTKLSRAADLVFQQLAMRTQGAVLVSWWQHPQSNVASGTSTSWLHSLPGEIIELHCKCDPEVAAERFFARRRHAGHLDTTKSKTAELCKFERFVWPGALGIGRVLELNTEQAINVEALVEQLVSPANPSIESSHVMPKHLFIGGLVAAGFDSTGAFLLAVSHNGRGVFLTSTWERVARDETVIYPEAGIVPGIGPLDGISVPVKEIDYETGVLQFSSPDGRLNFLYEEGTLTVSGETPALTKGRQGGKLRS